MVHFKYILAIGFLLIQTLSYGAEPTTQSSGVSVGVSECDEVRLSWANGDGSWRIVLIREGAAVDDVPSDGTSYFDNSFYGLGPSINGNYVISNNITNTALLQGLKQNTTYHVAIFEHDGGVSPDYLTSNPARFSFTTENINFDAYFEFTDSCQFTNDFEFKNRTTATFSGINYRWELGDGTVINGDSASHTYNMGGTYSVVLRVLNPKGCKSTYTLPRKAFCVPRPKSNPREENGDTIQCLDGNFFSLVDKTTIDNVTNASFTGKWTLPDGQTFTFPRINKSFVTPGDKLIKYVSETEMSNVKTGCVDSISFVLKVVDNPGNSIKKGDTVQCFSGNQFTFENKASNLSFTSWQFGDGDSSNIIATSHSYIDTGLYNVRHTATTIEGCSSSDTFPIIVKPNKDASFSISQADFCLNDGPALFIPTDDSGTFYGTNVIGREMTFTLPGMHTITHIVDDSICPDTIIQTFNVKPIPIFELRDSNICGGGFIEYTVNSGTTLLWENGNGNRTRQFAKTGSYWAKASENGCIFSDTFSLYVGAAPLISFPNDTLLCGGQVLLLRQSASAGTRFNWSTGSTDSIIVVTKGKRITLIATNGCGSSTKTINVRYLEENCDLFIPNSFSPNSSGPNDLFTFIEKNSINVEIFQIYNRWGHKVYDYIKSPNKNGWDGNFNGEPCPSGVYVYKLIYNTGPSQNIQLNTVQGVVHLMR